MSFEENVEKIFLDEIREKKKAGTGSFHKRGKGVKHGISGALRTPFFYMKAKERKKLNGEVESYNMYTIIPYKELELKDIETQKSLLIKWREIYENDKIVEDLGIPKSSYFKLAHRLELPKKGRGGARKGTTPKLKAKKEKTVAISSNLEFELEAPPEKPVAEKPIIAETPQPEVQKIVTKGLYLEFNDVESPEELSKLFTKLQLVIDGSPNKWSLSLSLTEKRK